uniref:Uncharacterized protein n=1 Tax=viral metagenome TaxID=1070528 RepID=A0A6C0AEJ5_9ZZZZ
MFSDLYKSMFKERINEFTALDHLHDPEWFDINWDTLVIYFIKEKDFRSFIKYNLLRNPEVKMLDVLFKHKFSFLDTRLVNLWTKDINLEVFKWIIDNKIFLEEDLKNKQICNRLLNQGNQISFDKFKYAFESGFPFFVEYSITISDIEVAEQIWQYLNSRNIQAKYTLGLNIRDLTFLKNYIEWIKSHGIEEFSLFLMVDSVAKNIGVSGLELLLENGYIRKGQLFELKKFSQEVVNWLLCHDFQEFYQEVVYHTGKI